MAILLYHDNEGHGPVVFSENMIAGERTGARRYEHHGHFLEVDAPDHVMRHDASEICRLPGYRLATAKEQQEYTASKRHEQQITESVEEPSKTGRRHK